MAVKCTDCRNMIKSKNGENDCIEDMMILGHDIEKDIFCSEYERKEQGKLRRFEICNPSDYSEIEHSDFETVAVACTVLGRGAYGLKEIPEGSGSMPVFIFGGHDEWFKETFGRTLDESLDHVGFEKLAEALESVVAGKSSLNDIEACAKGYAKQFRSKLKEDQE